jgi:hypothetical protein
MAPSQFLNDHVPLYQHFSDMYRVVAPNDIVFDTFVLGIVLLIDTLEEGLELVMLGACAVDLLIVALLQGATSDWVL